MPELLPGELKPYRFIARSNEGWPPEEPHAHVYYGNNREGSIKISLPADPSQLSQLVRVDGHFDRGHVAGALELADRYRQALIEAYWTSRPTGPQKGRSKDGSQKQSRQ